MASKRVDGQIVRFNGFAQKVLEELQGLEDQAAPEAVTALARLFVERAIALGGSNCPEISRDFAQTLVNVFPAAEARTSVVETLLPLCEEASALTIHLSRVIGKDTCRQPS